MKTLPLKIRHLLTWAYNHAAVIVVPVYIMWALMVWLGLHMLSFIMFCSCAVVWVFTHYLVNPINTSNHLRGKQDE